jgi:hypothetical protein
MYYVYEGTTKKSLKKMKCGEGFSRRNPNVSAPTTTMPVWVSGLS